MAFNVRYKYKILSINYDIILKRFRDIEKVFTSIYKDLLIKLCVFYTQILSSEII